MKNNLFMLLENILDEGKLEDFYLKQKSKFPKLLKQIDYLEQNKVPTNYAAWIIKQINVDSPEPIEDIVPIIQSFQKNQPKLDKKDINQYKSTQELNNTLEDLNKSEEEKQFRKRTISSSDIQDVLVEKDGWYVTFPHTTEASCDLGSNTTWCTARTQSGNLFLNYVAAKQDVILFYVINPSLNVYKEPFAKLSIGFIRGEPKFNLGDNKLTVNANNKNLTQEKFEEIVGTENASLFLSAMSKKAKELEGTHPAQKEMEAISQNYDLFLKKVATYKDTQQNYEAKKEFFKLLTQEYDPIYKIEQYIDKFNEEIENRITVARDPKTPPEVLMNLSKDFERKVIISVSINRNTPPETLEFLAQDEDSFVRDNIASNRNTSPETLEFLAQDGNNLVRLSAVSNPNTPPDTLEFLAQDEDSDIRAKIALNPNIPPEALKFLAKDKDSYVRIRVAGNPNTPPDLLEFLAKDVDSDVRMRVAGHPNTPPDSLKLLAKDPDYMVGYIAKTHQNFPKNLQENTIIFNSARFKKLAGI